MKPKYSLGEKVFAKVRGYPPWPAKVDGLADETPNKMRYHVSFYGTGETAVVKAEDICSYVENKSKLGKPKKHKNSFAKAMADVERELSPEDLLKVKSNNDEPSKDLSVSTDLDESTAVASEDKPETANKSVVRRASTVSKPTATPKDQSPPPASKAKPKEKKKSEPESANDDESKTELSPVVESPQPPSSPQKSPNQKSPNQKSPQPQPPTPGSKQPAEMSRAGRKLKPKRFADFDDTGSEDSPLAKMPKLSKKASEKSDKPEGDDFIYAGKEPNRVKIPLKLNRPVFEDAKTEDEWDDLVLKYALALKAKIDNGEFKEPVYSHMDNWTKEKAKTLKLTAAKSDVKFDHFNTEIKLIELDMGIKESLSLKKANLTLCLRLLGDLDSLPIKVIMLKKHPDIVTTVKKVKKYIGNLDAWHMTPEETAEFKESASLVRSKAEMLYNKLKSLFVIPSGHSFYEHFSQELAKFTRRTRTLSMQEVFGLVDEDDV